MCESSYIQVQCKQCSVSYMKRKDSLNEWQGNCIPCGRKKIANMSHVKILTSKRSSGEKSSFWRGGVCSENMKIRRSVRYERWRKSVFQRDNYTCQECGIAKVKFNAHHIKQFAFFPKLRFELSNGRTLCVECHRETPTYGVNQFATNLKCLTH